MTKTRAPFLWLNGTQMPEGEQEQFAVWKLVMKQYLVVLLAI